MSDIFISYASEDRERIMSLIRVLEKTGWSVFWDRTIPISKTWREVVGAEIESCRSMIVVWSKTSIMSDWVLDEAEEGKTRRTLFPVLIDDVAQPYGFRSIQAANLVDWDGEYKLSEFLRIITDLTALLGEPLAVVDEAKRKGEADDLKRIEEERKRQGEEEAKHKASEEEKRKAEKEKSKKEEEARRKAEEDERRRVEEVKRKAEEAAKGKPELPSGVKVSSKSYVPWLLTSAVIILLGVIFLFSLQKNSRVEEVYIPPTVTASFTGQPTAVTINGRQMLVNGELFTINGVGYSPVPIGVDPEISSPYGDYFTSDFSSIYDRDLPLIRQMGANTIRLWGWSNSSDHTDFLDKAYNAGDDPIYVIVTFWMGESMYPDITSSPEREQIKSDFRAMVAAHKNHPAVIMWSIGNGLNADWLYGGNSDDLFSLINEMAQEAHAEEGSNFHPVTTALLDSNLISTISTYNSSVTSLDLWGVNVYRGNTFGSLFSDYETVSDKPLVILEYGIDAYDDANGDEYENIGSAYQAEYAETLWNEISDNSDVCIGGTIMAYSDEWWKGKYSTDSDCSDNDPAYHGICGYTAGAHPDGYANEEWWGIMRTVDNGTDPDVMEPREIYSTLQNLWSGVILGDVNGDGAMDIVDALFIARRSIGLPVNNSNPDVTVDALTNELGQTIGTSNDIDGSITVNNPPSSFALVYPANGQTDLPTSLPLIWKKTTDPDGDSLTYSLYYCTDPDVTSCTPVSVASSTSFDNKGVLYGSMVGNWLILLVGLALIGSRKGRKEVRVGVLIAMLMIGGAFLPAFRDNGGGKNTEETPTPKSDEVGKTVLGLSTGTTYYWQVVAKDSNGGEIESEIRSFTTK